MDDIISQKKRDIEILEYKIIDINTLIANYVKHNISQEKIDMLKTKKAVYVETLEKIKSS